MSTNFILIRHGETATNQIQGKHGRLSPPLNEKGKIQAAEMAGALSEYCQRTNQQIAAIYSSSLIRAVESSEIILKQLNQFKLIKDPFLKTDLRLMTRSQYRASQSVDEIARDEYVQIFLGLLCEISKKYPESLVAIVLHGANIKRSARMLSGDWTIGHITNAEPHHIRITGTQINYLGIYPLYSVQPAIGDDRHVVRGEMSINGSRLNSE
jgi:broad specificity phosphatase PhoE